MDTLRRLSAERPRLSLPLTVAEVKAFFGLRSRFTAYQVLTDTQHLLKDHGTVVSIDANDLGTGTAIKGFDNPDIIGLMTKLRQTSATKHFWPVVNLGTTGHVLCEVRQNQRPLDKDFRKAYTAVYVASLGTYYDTKAETRPGCTGQAAHRKRKSALLEKILEYILL